MNPLTLLLIVLTLAGCRTPPPQFHRAPVGLRIATPIPTQVRTLPVLETPSGEIIYPQVVTSTP